MEGRKYATYRWQPLSNKILDEKKESPRVENNKPAAICDVLHSKASKSIRGNSAYNKNIRKGKK